ncbi:GtrA family protein [Ornithinimicrobium sp. Y1847]|uniref:GtrA family protein n=1 Tax=Ornithinimicrobium sp. Y1847 TaxID=3405419 RepID=UPI003B68333D
MTDAAQGATSQGRRPGPAAARFAALRDRVHTLLPGPLRRIIPTTAIGFAMLSSFTYAVDLAVLALMFRGLHLPYPIAVTVGYLVAFTLAFLLNRWLNFQSHGDVGEQTGRYVLTVIANYLIFILLLASTLEALGVHYLVARLIAGACEAVYMYLMMRLFVFRQKRYA